MISIIFRNMLHTIKITFMNNIVKKDEIIPTYNYVLEENQCIRCEIFKPTNFFGSKNGRVNSICLKCLKK